MPKHVNNDSDNSFNLKVEYFSVLKVPVYNPFLPFDSADPSITQDRLDREVSFSELSSYMMQLHNAHHEFERKRPDGRIFDITEFSQMAGFIERYEDVFNKAGIPKMRVRDFFEFESSIGEETETVGNAKVSLKGICEYFSRFSTEFIPQARQSGRYIPQRVGRGGMFNHFVKELRPNRMIPLLDITDLPYPNFLDVEFHPLSQPENPENSD